MIVIASEKVRMAKLNEIITQEMRDFFDKRTNEHIARVRKWCHRIAEYDPERFSELLERAKIHDDSKFEEPELTPYICLTWRYKCKDDGVKFEIPEDCESLTQQATTHHVTSNSHHPEASNPNQTGLINKEDRDKPPKEIVDATSMGNLDISEMVCDWQAMAEEKGGTTKEWADKNIGVRWKFTEEQQSLIYELIEAIKHLNK